MSKKHLSPAMINIQYWLFLIPVGIIRVLPLHGAYFLAKLAAHGMFFFDRKHRTRAVNHILHSGIRTELKGAKELAYASFLHMIKVFIEIVKFDQIITDENFHDYVMVAPDPVSQKMINPETTYQIILTTAHIGNWELAGGCLSHQCGIPMTSIGRALDNPKIWEFIRKRRCSYRHETFTKDKGLRPLLAAAKKGHNITIVADQHASTSEGVEVCFFGHPARAHATPALLHLKTGIPIGMPIFVRKDDDFHFEFHSPEPFVYEPTGDKDADVKAICQRYTSMIEQEIRQFPDQWVWTHRRWLDCADRKGETWEGNYETKGQENEQTSGK